MSDDPDERYRIVRALESAAAVDEAGMRGLIEGLSDPGTGIEWVNHGAGDEEEWISIAQTAEGGIAKNARAHLAIVRAAMGSENPAVRAALARVTPVDEPWEELGEWLQDPSPTVRSATLDRLRRLSLAMGDGEREAARYRIVLRGLVRAFADPDIGIVLHAPALMPFGEEAYKNGAPTPLLVGWRFAARELEKDEPSMFALVRERLHGSHGPVVASVACVCGLLHGRADIAEELATALLDRRAKDFVEWRIAWAIHEVGPVLAPATRDRLATTTFPESAVVQLWVDQALAAYRG